MAGGLGAFALSLAVIHLGAEWTSVRDRTFLGRIGLAGLCFTLAVVGGELSPPVFTVLVAAAVLGQLMLEALTPRTGAASVVQDSARPAENDRAPVGPVHGAGAVR